MTRSKFSLQILFLLFPFLVVAQGWERTYDGGGGDRVTCATNTLDGGVMMASVGVTGNIGDLLYPTFFKTDAAGNLTWLYLDSLHASSSDDLNIRDIINTSDGNYIYVLENHSSIDSIRYIIKMAPNGNTLWEYTTTSFQSIAVTYDGGILICLLENTQPGYNIRLVKLNQNGIPIWEEVLNLSDLGSYNYTSVIETMNHDILITGTRNYGGGDIFTKRLDEYGNILWENEYNSEDSERAAEMKELENGDIVIGGTSFSSISGYNIFLYKIDSDGNLIWSQTYPIEGYIDEFGGLTTTSGGGIAVAITTQYIFGPEVEYYYYLIKTDTDGNFQWDNHYGRNLINTCTDLLPGPDDGFYLSGHTYDTGMLILDAYLVKTDSLGFSIPQNVINGTVYFDENQDCLYDGVETTLSQWMVELKKGNAVYFRSTDSLGNYSFKVDTGFYELSVYPISEYWLPCSNIITIDYTGFYDTITQNFGMQSVVDCPLLEVSIATSFLRRCFDNTYNIHYCNYGTTTAEDAYVEVVLDEAMIFQEAGIPPSNQNGNVLLFDLGDVAVGDCGSFNVTVLLGDSTTCDSILLGQTHCVVAHIYPDSICLPTNNWSGASIEVDAACEGDSILFLIQNVGTAPTAPNLDYIIIEDDVVLLQGNFDLDPAESEPILLATNGSTFRLEAEQEPNHPGMGMPSVSVEGCGNNNVIFNWGFINIFAQNDGDPFVDINCLQNGGSYDPNDKTGFPLGYGEAHYISRGQDIEYLIRFQNTGTDTAFNIVILDTLSAFLDPISVRPGASSHPYEFGISGAGILSFAFNNIMLPDSNVNFAASNGFVQFKISQQPNLPLETAIHNRAAIYFDFNDAILTNTTLHTVGEPLLSTVSVDPVPDAKMEVKVFPNPFQSRTQFEMNGMDLQDGLFQLFDVVGRKWYTQQFSGSSFTFEKSDLAKGVYFFTIEDAGILLASGKVVVQ